MSGCRKRLNSTSPSAPASSSRSAISPVELKYGLSLTATGTLTTALTVLEDVDVALLDVAAGKLRITGEVVDVQLDRGGAGLLQRGRVVGPPSGGDPLRLAITGMSTAATARSSRLR